MWLYVPNTPTSSPSAPAEAGSISASDWRFPALAVSVWWRGKPSRSRNWFQRCERVSFMRLLCGAMPEPSTAAHGVAAWTASLAASRASRTAWLGGSAGATTSGTSGRTPGASLSKPGRGSSASKTSPACSRRGLTKSLEPSGYGETFAGLASRLRSDSSRRQKSARAMSASALLSSAWPTPDATNRVRDEETLRKCAAFRLWNAGQKTVPLYLAEVAKNWPTPTARDWRSGGDQRERPNGPMLIDAARIWATPQARDHMPPHSPDRVASMKALGHGMRNLNDEATLWATPRAHEVGQYTRDNGDPNRERLSLTGQAMQWRTPGGDGRRAWDERNMGAGCESGSALAATSGGPSGDALGGGHDGRQDDQVRRAVGRTALEGSGGNVGLFPPGPSDFDAWLSIAKHAPDRLPALSRHDMFLLAVRKALDAAHGDPRGRERLDPQGPYGLRAAVVSEIAQSCLRRRSDGLAARMDELRMLGNGVVPLQAAYAFRTLCARLAARGSAGAARLVRLMEAA